MPEGSAELLKIELTHSLHALLQQQQPTRCDSNESGPVSLGLRAAIVGVAAAALGGATAVALAARKVHVESEQRVGVWKERKDLNFPSRDIPPEHPSQSFLYPPLKFPPPFPPIHLGLPTILPRTLFLLPFLFVRLHVRVRVRVRVHCVFVRAFLCILYLCLCTGSRMCARLCMCLCTRVYLKHQANHTFTS